MIAICSAYKKALVGVEINGKRGQRELDANSKHSENLLPTLSGLLDEMNVKLEDNDCYAVIVGPGSFTGIRIGIALVKGLYAGGDHRKKVLPITTFDLMAYSYMKNNKADKNFVCVINALSDLFFICEYDKTGKQISQEKMINKEEYDAIKMVKVCLEEEGVSDVCVNPSADEFLSLALEKNNEKNYCEINELIPKYLRKSQAETTLEAKGEKINKK